MEDRRGRWGGFTENGCSGRFEVGTGELHWIIPDSF